MNNEISHCVRDDSRFQTCPFILANLPSDSEQTTPMASVYGMEFIETSVFTRHLLVLLTDEAYSSLQAMLRENPACGDVIRGSGGIRKVRYAVQAKGKSGGVRIIYYWARGLGQIYLLVIYKKSRKDTLSAEEVRILRKLVEEWLHG